MGDTKRHCPYLSVLVPACILEAHLTSSPLSHAPHRPCGTWQHSWLHRRLAYSLLHIFLLVYVLPMAVSSGGHPADFAVSHPNLIQWIQALASSSLWSAFVSCPKLQFAVRGAMTVSFILLLPYQPPWPMLLTLSCMGGHPGVRLPGWKTGGF